MTYFYPDHPVIHAIDLLHGQYDWLTDDSLNTVVVHYRDGYTATWQSVHVTGYTEPVIDTTGTRIYCCSMRRGLFCFEAATGKILWRNRRKAMRLVVNPNQTIACRYVGKLFLLSPDGEVRKEIRNISSNKIVYAGEFLFFLYVRGQYQLVSAQTLETVYTIPRSVIPAPEKIRFVRKTGGILEVEYFSDPDGDAPGEILRIPVPAKLP